MYNEIYGRKYIIVLLLVTYILQLKNILSFKKKEEYALEYSLKNNINYLCFSIRPGGLHWFAHGADSFDFYGETDETGFT